MILPDPMTPDDLDLRDLPGMILDCQRLRDSDIANSSSADAFRAAVLLWCVAWHQVPAASLPNDDGVLSRLAGIGGSLRKWRKVKAEALRGFVLCKNGRFYHPIIAEKALEASHRRDVFRARAEKISATKSGKKLNDFNKTASHDEFMKDASSTHHEVMKSTSGVHDEVKYKVKDKKEEEVVGFKNQESTTTTSSFVTRDLTNPGLQRQEKKAEFDESGPWRDLAVRLVQVFEGAGNPHFPNPFSMIPQWKEAGYDPKMIEKVVADGLAKKPDVKGLSYFGSQLSKEHEKRKLQGEAAGAPKEFVPDLAYWLLHLERWEREGGSCRWVGVGMDPSQLSTKVPMDLLIERGYRDADGKPWPQSDQSGRKAPPPRTPEQIARLQALWEEAKKAPPRTKLNGGVTH